MRKITADYVFIDSELKKNVIIIIDDYGTILDISINESNVSSKLEHYSGAIIPGLINCHCHLELSHLIHKVDTGIGLPDFLIDVVQQRSADAAEIQKHIASQDEYMWNSGIQAVGDICNTTDTISVKIKSNISYLSFIEMFDLFINEQAESSFNQYLQVYQEYKSKGLKASASPHAPYSVSDSLYKKINQLNTEHGFPVSIHNQETPSENDFTEQLSGDLTLLYKALNIPLTHRPSGKRSVDHALDRMDTGRPTLLVHNTMSESKDFMNTRNRLGTHYWVSCPRANLFIENRLPDYSLWQDQQVTICLGTDSLTSNWSLSIWQEMRTIHKYQSRIHVLDLLTWATTNGAQALGMQNELGSIRIGKSPGLLQVPTTSEGTLDLVSDQEPVRIA